MESLQRAGENEIDRQFTELFRIEEREANGYNNLINIDEVIFRQIGWTN